ncbi:MAG: LexA family transcriptional regulator [Dehalococcoidia bacterium]|nr:LexA family transcriptional regulator [Dehalococcoidia bacterium]
MRRRASEGLSSKQEKIIKYIYLFLEEKGYPPSIREIMLGCDISSTSVVDYNLRILVERNYIRRDELVSRGIEVLGRKKDLASTVQVPLYGYIAAGLPIPVPSADTWGPGSAIETIEINSDLAKGKTDLYALKVRGHSMIDALINDGDIVLMQAAQSVDNGEMAAVWLKDEKEVTLKKVYQEPGRVRLQPANVQMEPIYTHPDNVEIQGRVVGVIRSI